MNCVNLMGRLTRDTELRYAQNGTCIANFTLAVNRTFKKEGQPDADFINIVAFGKTAEFVGNYFKKGMQVAVTGKIQTRNYDDKEGKKVYVTEVVADQCYFADSKRENNDGMTTVSNDSSNPFTNMNDLPLPF